MKSKKQSPDAEPRQALKSCRARRSRPCRRCRPLSRVCRQIHIDTHAHTCIQVYKYLVSFILIAVSKLFKQLQQQ